MGENQESKQFIIISNLKLLRQCIKNRQDIITKQQTPLRNWCFILYCLTQLRFIFLIRLSLFRKSDTFYLFLIFHSFVLGHEKASSVPNDGMAILIPIISKYDPRDLPKSSRKLFKKGVFPHLRELERSGPKISFHFIFNYLNRVKYIQYLTALQCALYNEKMENKTSSYLQ